ncbi:MAG: hypothetical protein M9928_22695 [Anaerolineae bacterium]|nr:hypothetical protein [Anaerolineae bacterium]MCO5194861.1 hypothetical protein [Anaerolineae bacterium]MCO5207823.1 hypothetical protein [Anaerolineae bacterium]
MKKQKSLALAAIVLALIAIVTACGLTEQEVEQVVATVENLSSSELAGLSATIEALPQSQVDALATSASYYGVPTLSPNQVTAVVATVAAARATATAVGSAVASGERVNATEVPVSQAPIIVYFFASAPNQQQAESGIRYFLNYVTDNANRVEIFGHVMENPVEGSWPVYDQSDNWVLWAANDTAWVEQSLQVVPDSATGATLQNVTVNSNQINLALRDPQFVDGDQLTVDVNGVVVVNQYVMGGRQVAFPVTLNSGANTVTITTLNAGVTPPLVAEVSLSGVTAGPAMQLTGGLNNGQQQSFTITAP